MTHGPYELTADIEELLRPQARRAVTDRRGSSVWRVVGADGCHHAVKLGYPAAPTHLWTARAPAREAHVLGQLGRRGIHWGEWERGTWSVQPWHEGESLWHRWAPYRSGRAPADRPIAEALSCAERLAELHRAGWVHGDVQPFHFLLGAGDTHLIDLGLARGGPIPAAYDFAFRGCLVMYESPEISRSVLATGRAGPTGASDVFGLGASLFISLTGQRAVDFPADAERAEQRRVVAAGRHHREVTVPGPLGKVIAAMLSPEPADRPDIAEVCAALS